MLKKLSGLSFTRLKKILPYSLLICIFEGILASLLMFMGSFNMSVLFFLVLPFLVMPSLFTTQLIHSELDKNGESVSLPHWYKGFALYFKNSFRGSYHYINTYFITFLVFALLFDLFGYISFGITSSVYPSLNEIAQELADALNKGRFIEIFDLFPKYHREIFMFLNIQIGIPLILSTMLFLSLIFYNSFFIYFRKQYKQFNTRYLKGTWNYIKRLLRKEIMQKFFFLNWPMYLVIILAYAAGFGIFIPLFDNTYLVIILTISVFILIFGCYLPFFFTNMETIYASIKDKVISYEIEMRKSIINAFGESNDTKNSGK